jgi:hypothetical protein
MISAVDDVQYRLAAEILISHNVDCLNNAKRRLLSFDDPQDDRLFVILDELHNAGILAALENRYDTECSFDVIKTAKSQLLKRLADIGITTAAVGLFRTKTGFGLRVTMQEEPDWTKVPVDFAGIHGIGDGSTYFIVPVEYEVGGKARKRPN